MLKGDTIKITNNSRHIDRCNMIGTNALVLMRLRDKSIDGNAYMGVVTDIGGDLFTIQDINLVSSRMVLTEKLVKKLQE